MKTRPENASPPNFSVAIIGGGFTGATLAAQLRRRIHPSRSIVVIERTCLPGCGLAYATQSPSHLLNVPVKSMSAFAGDPGHFLRWARLNHDSAVGPGDFLPRGVYGRYVGSIAAEAVARDGEQQVEWKKDEVCSLSPTAGGSTEIRLSSGDRMLANRVVLALGNFPPSDPFLRGRDVKASCRYTGNPWSTAAYEGVRSLAGILLVGSGPTSLDVAVELRSRGFCGTVHILSRHGLLPLSHKAVGTWPSFWNQHSPKDVLGLLRLIRQQTLEARRQGVDWRSVIDSLRPHTEWIWQSLPEREKRRFLRHVRTYWEVHRHRAAPEIAKSIAEQIAHGQITHALSGKGGSWNHLSETREFQRGMLMGRSSHQLHGARNRLQEGGRSLGCVPTAKGYGTFRSVASRAGGFSRGSTRR